MDDALDGQQGGEAKWNMIPSGSKRRQWSEKEEGALIEALHELCRAGWKTDNGVFRTGYAAALEKAMESKVPGSNLKASPHIDSRLKVFKKHCCAIADMKGAAGIHWDNEDHMVLCDNDDVWQQWVESHPYAKGLRNKPFPYYDDLCIIFGKNETNGKGVEMATGGAKALGHKVANNDEENGIGSGGSSDTDVLIHDVQSLQVPVQDSSKSTPSKKRKRCGNCLSSEAEELTKMLGTFLEQNKGLLAVFTTLLKAKAAAAEKRAKLNGELMKLSLNLQARLRAAYMIVCDPAKVDLFFSLPDDEKAEWVSMLLLGLV
ncbi:uncharacterized protein LOC117915103 [Vitis riparia]|uniref:uncharacterized protein LOC117915103 n=1 Tax=Vitis riparia TaxID=96939 RepID=UPI00155A3B93|nr:uncharacterized protein LOC117915103 [Vitis riparia]